MGSCWKWRHGGTAGLVALSALLGCSSAEMGTASRTSQPNPLDVTLRSGDLISFTEDVPCLPSREALQSLLNRARIRPDLAAPQFLRQSGVTLIGPAQTARVIELGAYSRILVEGSTQTCWVPSTPPPPPPSRRKSA